MRAGLFKVSAYYKNANFDAGTVVLPKDDYVIKVDAVGGIAGRVEGTYGEKITQFRMQARPDQPNMTVGSDNLSSSQLQSDAQGAFKIENLAPGTYRLMVVAEGYAPRVSEPIEVKPGEITKDVVIHLSGGGNVEVHVVDPTGRSVQGAFVFTDEEARRFADYNQSWPKSWTRQTDKGGLYTFKWQAEGKQLAAVAYHPDYAEGRGAATVVAGKTQRLEIALTLAGMVQGTVYDRAGQPKPAVAVLAYGSFGARGSRYLETRTNDAGRYELRSLAPGRWQVSANFTPGGSRYTGQSQSVELTAGQTITVDFREASGRIFGVVARAGAPLPGADVSAYAQSQSGQPSSQGNAQTNAQGQYECLGLAPGKYNVTAYLRTPSGRSGAQVQQQVELAENESREVNLTIPTGAIRGVVVREADSTAVSGARGSGQRQQGAESSPFSYYAGDVQTDADGRFEMVGLGAGKYRLSAREGSGGTSTTGAVDVELAEGQVLEDVKITLGSGGTLEGTVAIAGQAGPLPQDAQLVVMPRDGSAGIDRYGSNISVDRTTGAYKSSGFPAGDYAVLAVVSRGALGLQIKAVSVRKGETSRLDFELGPGVRLRFHISDAAGGAPQTVGFGCTNSAGLSLMPRTLPKMPVADLERLYQEIAFSREAYRFTFTADGYKTANVDVNLVGYPDAEKEVAVVLEKES